MLITLKLATGSILIGLVVLGLKMLAYYLTGSIALYSDALESVINLVTALAALTAVRLAARPASHRHPYGYHKAEYLSAVLEGVLIVLAALSILREAYFGFISPKPLDASFSGLAFNGLATLINAAWSWVLIRGGRKSRSTALEADGRHLLTDVITSAGTLAGVGLVFATGWQVFDPGLAALVAINILWSGWRLVKDSVAGLMDEAVAPEILTRIRHVISTHAGGAIEAHDVRTRHAGRMTFIDFHLVVPSTMLIAEAHEICDRLEGALKAEIEDAVTTIHVEPENKAKHSGVLVL